jgi:hypothetical protein
MQRNEAMGEAKHNEMRPWERPNIWLRNGTHLELYSFEHEYSLTERNKGMRKTMNFIKGEMLSFYSGEGEMLSFSKWSMVAN